MPLFIELILCLLLNYQYYQILYGMCHVAKILSKSTDSSKGLDYSQNCTS